MDQIASACGISKKTLYKYVSNKNDLLSKSFNFFADSMAQVLFAINNSEGNAIDDFCH